MDVPWPRSRTYLIGSILNWTAFLAVVAFLSWREAAPWMDDPLILVLIAVLAASVAGQFLAAYRLIAAQDEFVRAITAKRVIAAAGVTMTAAVLYGLASQFLGAPRVPMWVVYPFFWGAIGMVTPFVQDSRA